MIQTFWIETPLKSNKGHISLALLLIVLVILTTFLFYMRWWRKEVYILFLTLLLRGKGGCLYDIEQLCGFPRPPNSKIYWNVSCWLFLSIYLLIKYPKKNWVFFQEYPPFSPLKSKTSQKWPPMTAYNPYFLLQNPILL